MLRTLVLVSREACEKFPEKTRRECIALAAWMLSMESVA